MPTFTSDRVTLRDLSRPIRKRHGGACGPYYFDPGPAIDGRRVPEPDGFGGYLNRSGTAMDEGSFVRLRVVGYADEIARLGHRGWFLDDSQGDVARGIVLRLPRGRGFLAGWTMGPGMATSVARRVLDSDADAARAADEGARIAAEHEREYRAANDFED